MMDIDHIFVGIHVRVLRLLSRSLSRALRLCVIAASFVYALAIIVLLMWLHIQHVHISPNHQSFLSPAPSICAPALIPAIAGRLDKVIEIIITGPGVDNREYNYKPQQQPEDVLDIPDHLRGARVSVDLDALGNVVDGPAVDGTQPKRADNDNKQRANQYNDTYPPGSVVYEYSRERGYFTLSKRALSHHAIERVQYYLAYDHACFGPHALALITYKYVGYDTIILNQLITIFGYRGFVRNKKTFDLYALNSFNEEREGEGPGDATADGAPAAYIYSPTHKSNHWIELRYTVFQWAELLLYKLGLLIMVLFLFFSVTTLVSLTLTQTQIRMLIFTEALRSSIRLQAPIMGLVLEHLVQSLAFVPVVIGILFFLFEFFADQILAFLLLLLVWICESFTVMFVRVDVSMRYFPKIFAVYFMCFGLYFFNFPYGFHYLAIMATYGILQFFMCFFLFLYEVPAVMAGEISLHRPRMLVLKRRGNTVQMRNMNQVEVNPAQLNSFHQQGLTGLVNIEQDRLRMQQQTERLMRLMMSINLQVQQQHAHQQALMANAGGQTQNEQTQQTANNEQPTVSLSPLITPSAANPSSAAAVPSDGFSLPASSAAFPSAGGDGTSHALASLRQLPEMLSSMIRNAQTLRTMTVQQQTQMRQQAQAQAQTQATAAQSPTAAIANAPAAAAAAGAGASVQSQAQLNHLRTHIFEQLAHALQVSLYVLNTLVYGSGTLGFPTAPSAAAEPSPVVAANALPLLQSIRHLQNQLAHAQQFHSQASASGAAGHRRNSRSMDGAASPSVRHLNFNAFPVGVSSSGPGSATGSNSTSPLLGPISHSSGRATTPSAHRPRASSIFGKAPTSFEDYMSIENEPNEFDLNAAEVTDDTKEQTQ